jgi:hypothetical protein
VALLIYLTESRMRLAQRTLREETSPLIVVAQARNFANEHIIELKKPELRRRAARE